MTTDIKPKIEVLPLKEKALADRASRMPFLIRITGPEIQVEKSRPQLNLGLVLDRSGSMSGRKLKNAKKALCYCVDHLLPTDQISVTVFDNRVYVIVPSVPAEARRKIKAGIGSITAGNTTALHAGWVEGGKQVASCLDPKRLNRVILVTDGLANVGLTDTDKIVTQAKGLYERGISTTTIGVGQDFNEDLLVPMAKAASGNSWFVEGPEDFQRIFETELEGLLREVCTCVTLQFQPQGGAEILTVLNAFGRIGDRSYELPNLLSGEPLDIMVEVGLPGGKYGKTRVFDVLVEWKPQGATETQHAEAKGELRYAPEERVKIQQMNVEVLKAIELLSYSRAREMAMDYLDAGDLGRASDLMLSSSRAAQALAGMAPDPLLIAEADELANLSRGIKEGRDLRTLRKRMAYQSVQRQRGRKEKRKDQRS